MDFQRKPSWADLDSDDIASIASDDLAANRPNRWTGPKSTWRHLTEQERLLWQSMARLRDQDLGVHLYNAFALKQQAKDPEAVKFLTVKLDDGQDAVWTPPRAWTAWPMKPSELPAEPFLKAETDENDHFTFRRTESELPSADLEAEMHAHILRHAKRRFRKHMSRLGERTTETILPSTEAAASPGAETIMMGMESQTSAPSSRAVSVVKEGSMPASGLEDGGGYDTEASSATTSRRRKRKLQDLEYHGPRGHPGRYNQDRKDYEPRIMEDEEYAESLLRMPVRHILSQLDKTLTILHYGREAGVSNLSDSSDTEEVEDDEEVTSAGEQSRAQTGKGRIKSSQHVRGSSANIQTPRKSRRGRPRKEQLPLEGETHEEMLRRTARESHRALPPTEEEREAAFDAWLRQYDPTTRGHEEDEEEEDEERERGPHAEPQSKRQARGERDQEAKRATRERRLDKIGLRDWSDVLGAAALAGFPEAVVARTARRCAELFGEGMVFRQMHQVGAEGGSGVTEKVYRPETIVLQDSDKDDDDSDSGDAEDGIRVSLADVNIKRRMASRQASLVRKRSISPSTASTTSSHISHARGRPQAPSTTRSRSRSKSQSQSRARSRSASRSSAGMLYCPVLTCPRAVEGFGRRSNLTRHIQKVHGQSLEDAEAGMVDSADEMEGGVHVDGFLRQIVPAAGWRGQDLVVRKRRKGRRRGSDDDDEDDDHSD